MKPINKLSFPESKFDLYFLAYDSAPPTTHWTDREGLLELTHNYGTEHDDAFQIANGNSDPGKGFGHICVSVDNLQAACARLEGAGYKFQKKLSDGRMRSIAFALDPDGYWVEIIGQNAVEETEGVEDTRLEKYRLVSSAGWGLDWIGFAYTCYASVRSGPTADAQYARTTRCSASNRRRFPCNFTVTSWA